jgi:hypothetical protein
MSTIKPKQLYGSAEGFIAAEEKMRESLERLHTNTEGPDLIYSYDDDGEHEPYYWVCANTQRGLHWLNMRKTNPGQPIISWAINDIVEDEAFQRLRKQAEAEGLTLKEECDE